MGRNDWTVIIESLYTKSVFSFSEDPLLRVDPPVGVPQRVQSALDDAKCSPHLVEGWKVMDGRVE